MPSGKAHIKRLFTPVLRPRSTSPRPPSPPTQLANPAAGPVSSSADALQSSHPAASSYAAGSIVHKQNVALAAAIEKHLADLPNAEKDAFRNASRTIDEKTMLDRISTFDQNHHDASSFRQCAPKLEATLRLLDKFMAGISIAIQANPDPSSIVVGAIRVVLDVAIGFVEFFSKLADMICRLGDFLEPLAEYAKAPPEQKVLHEALAAAYGDLLKFCLSANKVFTDQNGQKRKWTSFRIFWRVNWVPFEAEFGTIKSNFKHHLDALLHSAAGVLLDTNFEANLQEKGIVLHSFMSDSTCAEIIY